MSVLGEALGMDLELDAQEASVGGYALDILARDRNGRQVVIENQLEATDHTQLGQLLTHAAGFDANVIVWIAKEFRDEHRDALDLLNRRTGEDTDFFGIEVSLWRIDDPWPAVCFNLVATPNEWPVSSVWAKGVVWGRSERYQAFFRKLVDTMRKKHNFPYPSMFKDYSYHFITGHSRIRYGANFAERNRARVELYIANNRDLFNQLRERKAAIESELGETLEWDLLHIAAVRPGSIDDEEETLREIREWMVERLLKFKQVFGPRLDELVV